MTLKILYKILWTLIMLTLEFYEKIYLMTNLLKFKIISLFYNNNYTSDFHYLKRCYNELTKLPKHLSIIIGSEQIDKEVLTKITVYALMSNIKFISFYDIKGECVIDQRKIPKFISCKKIQNNRYLWSMPSEKSEIKQNGYKNGLEKSIEIVNLTSNDNKLLLIKICKRLCTDKNSTEIQDALKLKENFTHKINEIFQKELNYLPDPELAIIFDKTMCTYGLLPWQTSFTEFHNINTINCFNVQMYAKILYKFSKCEQRFGK